MSNARPSPLPALPTEQIQKYLEENKELIMAVLECQNQGKFGEIAKYQSRLQNNLVLLARYADFAPQEDMHSQEQDLQQSHVAMSQQQQQGKSMLQPHAAMSQQKQQGQSMLQPHVAMSQQQADHSTSTFPMGMSNEQQQQQQQQHLAISLQQPGHSTSNLPFQMNEQQRNLQAFFHQQLQLVPGTSDGMYQASQTRRGNMLDAPPSNHFGSGMGPGWS